MQSYCMLLLSALVASSRAVVLQHAPARNYGVGDESLTVGDHMLHISQKAKQDASAIYRDQEPMDFRGWLIAQTATEFTAEATSSKPVLTFQGVPFVDPDTLIAIAIDDGKDYTFDAMSSLIKTKILNQSASFLSEFRASCYNFEGAADKELADDVVVASTRKLFVSLADKIGPYQAFLSNMAHSVNESMSENLRAALAPWTSFLHHSAGNPFDVEMLGGGGEDGRCETTKLVFAGLGQFGTRLEKAHRFLNSTALAVVRANVNPYAFLVPRLTSMVLISMLSLEEAHHAFMAVVAPIINRRLRCGFRAGQL